LTVAPGLPVPSRRTFAPGILPYAHCGESCAAQSLLRLLSQPARGHGQPLPDLITEEAGGSVLSSRSFEDFAHGT
jgi:hypothetical protein